MQYDELAKEFGKEYGPFKYLLVGDGFKPTIKRSFGLTLGDDYVEQTKEGAKIAHDWMHQQSTRPQIKVKAPVEGKNLNLISNRTEFKSFTELEHGPNDCVLDQPGTSNLSPTTLNHSPELSPLLEPFKDAESSYSFFLISGKNTPPDQFKGISNIPWVKVFDFDIDSKSKGLLSSVEKDWSGIRYSTVSTCATGPKSLANDSTDWVFPLGYSDMLETVYDGSPLTWYKENKPFLEKQFSAIANFCTIQTAPVFIILWYDSEKSNVKYLEWILLVLSTFTFHELKQIILCVDKSSCDNSFLQDVIDFYGLSETTIDISAGAVYQCLAKQTISIPSRQSKMSLPSSSEIDKHKVVDITDEVLILWIQQFIEILPLESQDKVSTRKLENFGEEFLKGGVISWDELAGGSKLAVRREGKAAVSKCLENDVFKKQTSIILRIQHAPGAGGTTFARQMLWDLHFKLPCGVVKPAHKLSIADICEGVRHLSDLTKLPVVLLIDGHSEFEINQIFENCKYAVVILHVQRYSKQIPKNDFLTPSRTCRLPGSVTIKEAKNLTKVFSSYSRSAKTAKTLEKFTKDVENKTERYLYEYGLATFNHEFKGVRSYVAGYLKLQEQASGVKNLQNWQRVVGFLSLALYYGQSGVHRETFRHLLKVNKKFVTLKNLDSLGRQFVIQAEGEWKITHNVVAKEILEQILSGCTSTATDCLAVLGEEAKTNLHELVIEFILLTKDASEGNSPESLVQLLTDVIIKRDYSEVDKSDGIAKDKFSKLLEDIPSQQKKVEILQHLTEAFPENAEFHAHLGRMLNIMKEFSPAEESLKKALRIRKAECSTFKPNFTDDMLSRIHHMTGVGYSKRVEEERSRADQKSYQNMMNYVLEAVKHFEESRRRTTHNLTYGCIGEIRVRLLLVDFVKKKFPDGCRRAFNFELGEGHTKLSELVRESHSVCDRLLAESLQYSTEQELERINIYAWCVDEFNRLFGQIKSDMMRQFECESNPTISMRRSQIACLKMRNQTRSTNAGSKRPCIEDVKNKEDLQEIIKQYESIFRQIFYDKSNRESVSVDIVEYLEAIRHRLAPDDHSLEDILKVTRNWEKRNEPGYATFYFYVINFMMAVFTAGADLNEQYIIKAIELKDKLQSQRIQCDVAKMQAWQLEWIAEHSNATSIRKLINRDQLGAWDKEKRFWTDPGYIQKLQVFTGTVTQSKHPLKGTISLNLTQSKYKCRIEVYFVPKAYNLSMSYYAEQKQRVEFYIGFSCKHGAQAFEVQKLRKQFCPICKVETEVITLNAPDGGKCRVCSTLLHSLFK